MPRNNFFFHTGLFSVSSNGRITTAAEIDKEMIDSAITFVITATDNGGLNDTVMFTTMAGSNMFVYCLLFIAFVDPFLDNSKGHNHGYK